MLECSRKSSSASSINESLRTGVVLSGRLKLRRSRRAEPACDVMATSCAELWEANVEGIGRIAGGASQREILPIDRMCIMSASLLFPSSATHHPVATLLLS